MSYEAGYQSQQRPYAGPAAQRPSPAPASGPAGYPPGPPQQYDGYDDDYGYEYYDQGDGYGNGNGNVSQYADAGYGQAPRPDQRHQPQHDYYGAPYANGPGIGGRPPMNDGRGGHGMRGGPYPPRGGGGGDYGGGPGRGFGHGPPHGGRGGWSGPMERSANSEPASQRSANFPPYSGQQRRGDFDDDRHIADRMGAMDISQHHVPPMMGRGSGGPPRGPVRSPNDDFGRPPVDGGRPQRGPPLPPHGFEQRRPGPAPGYGNEHDGGGYDRPGPGPSPRGPPREEFGPPSRSMTMPANEGMPRRGPGLPPQRMDSMPYGPPPNRGMPSRPSTSQGNRPPPNRAFPPNQGGARTPGPYGGPDYNRPPPANAQHRNRASLDAAFDGYAGSRGGHGVSSVDAMAPARSRASLDLHMEPGMSQGPGVAGMDEGPNMGGMGGRGNEMTRTKSQPDLRKQGGGYDVSNDVPPLPQQHQNGYQQYEYGGGGGGSGGQVAMGRRPSGAGLPSNPAAAKSPSNLPRGPSPSQSTASSNPDALPSHPTPVRPGLMADSMVSMASNKPAPVRNYASPSSSMAMSMGSTPSAATLGSASMSSASGALLPGSGPSSSSTRVAAPVTEEELERLRVAVKADPGDQASAMRLSERLVEASDVLVVNIPDPKARSRLRDRYLADAHKILKKLAGAGNMEAMFFLADCLGRGLFGHEPDDKEAFTLYQSAAKLGHAKAAYRTAVCCELGHEERGGTRKDPLKAIQWYKRAATLGDPPAMYKMGIIQLKGLLGQAKNPREAVGWLKRAAERADSENPHALHELGLLYESAQPNDVILRDEQYAFSLFRQAAELGYKFSQFRLGCAYEYGLMACPVDPRLSIMWYSKAAMQEEHQSELALSGWYLTGSEGVLGQSDTEAYLWARKAAMAGLAKAEYAMGYFTEVGIGVPANMDDAKRWYWRAAAQDFPKARERLEDLKRSGRNGPRQRERISRSKIGRQQEGECLVM